MSLLLSKIITIPSVVDCHVHLRIPGGEHKEDFLTGSRAALAGGISTVLAMPNTNPPLDCEEFFLYAHQKALKEGLCTIKHFVGATDSNTGISRQSNRIATQAAGLKLYINETFGSLRINDEHCIREHVRSWVGRGPVAAHAEQEWVPFLISLADQYKVHIHLCHISHESEIHAIRSAKEQGISITCEVCPHHLFLTEKDAEILGSKARVSPPINQEKDRMALWNNLAYIDCLASDHAPHTLEEKMSDQSPPGFPGLETLLPLGLLAVEQEKLSLERLMHMVSVGPRTIFTLHDPIVQESKTVIELEERGPLSAGGWNTKCDWSPFADKVVPGKILETYVGSRCMYRDGKFLVSSTEEKSTTFGNMEEEDEHTGTKRII